MVRGRTKAIAGMSQKSNHVISQVLSVFLITSIHLAKKWYVIKAGLTGHTARSHACKISIQ